MELHIKDFEELEQYLKRKQQHTDELEHLNTELTIENRRLKREIREIEDLRLRENRKIQQEVDRLKKLQAEYINQILNRKKPSAETDDQADIITASIPHIFRKQEQ